MSGLFIALAVGAGFLLGLRVGLALGHRNERKRRELSEKKAAR
jgi:hypothetical protein